MCDLGLSRSRHAPPELVQSDGLEHTDTIKPFPYFLSGRAAACTGGATQPDAVRLTAVPALITSVCIRGCDSENYPGA
ncbi:unnamed protein product [Gadus morhua 'NCC']